MKKNYLSVLLFVATLNLFAQQTNISFETAEGFQLGNLHGQNAWEVSEGSNGVLQSQIISDEQASQGSYSFKNAYDSGFNSQWLPIFGAAKTFNSPKSFQDFTFSYDIFITDTLGSDFEFTLYGIDANDTFVPVAGIGMENRGMVYIIIDENYSADYTTASWVPQSWVNVRIEVSASAVKYYLDNTLIYTANNFSQLDIEGFNMLHNNYGEDAYYDNMTYYNGSLSVDQIELVEVKLYPNPAVNELKIQTPKGIAIKTLEIFDLSGKQILHSNESIAVDISSLSKGTYFVKINTNRGSISKKIIKK